MPRVPAYVPESLGTELNIEGIRTEAQIVDLWIRHVLTMCRGNKTVAARVLGIDRRSLYRRLGTAYKCDEGRGSFTKPEEVTRATGD